MSEKYPLHSTSKQLTENGFSFVEILFSLFLSALLMTVLIEQLISAKKQYHFFKSALENTLALEWVENLMKDSLQRAGFTPCLRVDRLVSNDFRTHNAIRALIVGKTPLEGFSVNRMSEYFNTAIQLKSNALTIFANASYRAHDLILITDCYHAELQEIRKVQRLNGKTVLQLKSNLLFDYQKPIYLGKWIEEHFFIQKTKGGKKALFYRRSNRTDELTPLITHLAIDQAIKKKWVLKIELRLNNQDKILLATTVRS